MLAVRAEGSMNLNIFQIYGIAHAELQRRWPEKLRPLKFIYEPDSASFAYETKDSIEINVPKLVKEILKPPSAERRIRLLFALLAHEVVGHDYGLVFNPPAESARRYLESLPRERKIEENVPVHFQLAICDWPDCIRKLRTRRDFSKMYDILMGAYVATFYTIRRIVLSDV
jgi:hypothetical protein